MAQPIEEYFNPTMKQLYEDLYLDYFIEYTKRSFPQFLSRNEQYVVFIRLLTWAVARSYQQPRILQFFYSPDFVMDVLVPRLADTLSFQYPLEYPEEQLRFILKYLQKIRRSRGTIESIKMLVRLLNVTEDEVLNMSLQDYSSVEVEACKEKGEILIHYNNVRDWDFAHEIMKLIMPAGYNWRLESGYETEDQKEVRRNRFELVSFGEYMIVYSFKSGEEIITPLNATYGMIIEKTNHVTNKVTSLLIGEILDEKGNPMTPGEYEGSLLEKEEEDGEV